MQLKKLLLIAFSFQLLAFNFVSASGGLYVPSGPWQRPESDPPYYRNCPRPPIDPNDPYANEKYRLPDPCSPPINVSTANQTKASDLTIYGIFSTPKIFTNKLGIGSATVDDLDQETAVLDVGGQIRIRGGCSAGDCANKVLKASTGDNGLAVWGNPLGGLQKFNDPTWFTPQQLGIILTDIDHPLNTCDINTANCRIEVATTTIQTRITGTCTDSKAITTIAQNGAVTCSVPLVSSVTVSPTNSGLTNSSTAWTPVLSVNPGAGLEVSGNIFRVKPPANGSGLVISNNYLRFATTTAGCSGNNVYWKYDTTNGWNCGSPIGEGILLLSSYLIPPACPNLPTSNWTDLLNGFTTEHTTGPSGYGNTTKTRICQWNRIDSVCQVMYLTNTSLTTEGGAATPAACPTSGGWIDNNDGINGRPLPLITWAPGNAQLKSYTNYTRTCYRCN